MALMKMDFAMGGGEHYEETLLWENDPSLPAITQNIQLSDSVDNYSKIKIVYYPFGTYSPHTISDAEKCEMIIPPTIIPNTAYNSTGIYVSPTTSYSTSVYVYCPNSNDRTILGPIGGAAASAYNLMKVKAIYGIK